MTYQLHAGEGLEGAAYTPHGGCREFFYCHDREHIAEGPAETGKTLAACWRIHMLASKYPGLNGAIVRKSYKSMVGSVLQTFGRVIAGCGVDIYGGPNRPDKYTYPNGSVVWVGGMDNPDKVLSSERDFVYVNQAEELALEDWEYLTTRTTGRGAVMPYTYTCGDCNPAGARHWIRQRAASDTLRLIRTTHKDNPTLYDGDVLTERGRRVMETLGALTGVRRRRLLEGVWATAEGAVYDTFDAAVHVADRPASEMVRWMMCQDEGYTNPAVILLVGEDSDGRWHVAREYYERGVLQSAVVAQVVEWYNEVGATVDAVDAAAAGLIADLRDAGVPAVAAKGRVLDGIQATRDRLAIAGDGRPRLTVAPECVNLINEFESYVWRPERDEPVKENDHALDALRYLWAWWAAGASWVMS